MVRPCLGPVLALAAALAAAAGLEAAAVKKIAGVEGAGENLLKADAWRPYGAGFARDGEALVCDNGADAGALRGASQTLTLNQARPQPIVAVAWSRAEGVGGRPDSDFSLYLDLQYADGEPLWGQTADFAVGTHDWQRREVRVYPAKPVRLVTVHLLLRRHAGKAAFRGAELREVPAPAGFGWFDGLPVTPAAPPAERFLVRDVAAGSDFVAFEGGRALGLELAAERTERDGATFLAARLADTTGRDRAVTLAWTWPVAGAGWRWLADPRREEPAEPPREYLTTARFAEAGSGRLSRYPLAAVARGTEGRAIAIDMSWPAFFRVGFAAGGGELFVAYDLGLAPEKPSAEIRFAALPFDAAWGFRGALARLYAIFPDHFRCRTPRQGLWMPFHAISKVEGWEDFGFRFKEGHNETAWDHAHDVLTFRYTEPMTWWMRMPKDLPRTREAAEAEARRLAAEGNPSARALESSGFHDADGRWPARLLNTPWCDGAVWSLNTSPGVAGDVTDFRNKWNPALRTRFYGPGRKGDLDGEYVDSCEGYVTDVLNYRRDHFAAARTPLVFAADTHRPALFRGLIAYEYVRTQAEDVHAMGRLMMANGCPGTLPWLIPWVDVGGTETNWNPRGRWTPMSDAELLFRRALCGPKPYCFLMNTDFDAFSHALVEKYMKRCLAYGMFPGFFSADAATGHYFSRPDLYNRDRPLFRKYVPLVRRVAEAAWRPVTGARSSDPAVHVERFGDTLLTVFNAGGERRTVTVALDGPGRPAAARGRELVGGTDVAWADGRATLALDAEDVAVLELPAAP